MLDININIKVPEGEYCAKCKFQRVNGLTKDIECMIFDKVLKQVRIENNNLCEKCSDCEDESIDNDDE